MARSKHRRGGKTRKRIPFATPAEPLRAAWIEDASIWTRDDETDRLFFIRQFIGHGPPWSDSEYGEAITAAALASEFTGHGPPWSDTEFGEAMATAALASEFALLEERLGHAPPWSDVEIKEGVTQLVAEGKVEMLAATPLPRIVEFVSSFPPAQPAEQTPASSPVELGA
jgi:hypothetical protein